METPNHQCLGVSKNRPKTRRSSIFSHTSCAKPHGFVFFSSGQRMRSRNYQDCEASTTCQAMHANHTNSNRRELLIDTHGATHESHGLRALIPDGYCGVDHQPQQRIYPKTSKFPLHGPDARFKQRCTTKSMIQERAHELAGNTHPAATSYGNRLDNCTVMITPLVRRTPQMHHKQLVRLT